MRKETFVIIFTVQFALITGKLIGDHICQDERRYLVNETEYFIKNATVRHYQWCLNVPPRCSFYTTKEVEASQIVEKEVVDVVETCCPGFQENDQHYCEPICPQCLNGVCQLGICECLSGFKGDLCDEECDLLEWGPNCKFKCTCELGSCNSSTGNCRCPPGFTGDRCELMCQQGSYGENCKEECDCGKACHHVTGICASTSTTTTTSTTTVEEIESPTIIDDTTTLSVDALEPNDNFTVIKVNTNGKFVSNGIEMEDNDSGEEVHRDYGIAKPKTPTIPSILKADLPLESREVDVNIDNEVLLKSLEDHELPTLIQHDKFGKINIDQSTISKNDIINNASAVTAMTTVIIVLILVIILMGKYERKRNKIENERQKVCVHTVSVCTQNSAFHPTISETALTLPGPVMSSFRNSNIEAANLENSKYSYDQLPSSATARAAFVPELFDIQTVDLAESNHVIEPVYDEIPSRTVPVSNCPPSESYKSPTLYANTYAKTRL